MSGDGIVRFSFENDKISVCVIRVVDGVPREATALIDGAHALAYGDTLKALGEFKINEAAQTGPIKLNRDSPQADGLMMWSLDGCICDHCEIVRRTA